MAFYKEHIVSYKDLQKLFRNEVNAIDAVELVDTTPWLMLAKAEVIAVEDSVVFTEALTEALRDESCEELTDEQIAHFGNLLVALKAAFRSQTNGLELTLHPFDLDCGDNEGEPDHHDGCAFVVRNVVSLTPAGEAFKDHLTEYCWGEFS